MTCDRCGHETRGCPKCGRNDPMLGGHADGRVYCHTFSVDRPTCYELATNPWLRVT